jgi:hypothetical protein
MSAQYGQFSLHQGIIRDFARGEHLETGKGMLPLVRVRGCTRKEQLFQFFVFKSTKFRFVSINIYQDFADVKTF